MTFEIVWLKLFRRILELCLRFSLIFVDYYLVRSGVIIIWFVIREHQICVVKVLCDGLALYLLAAFKIRYWVSAVFVLLLFSLLFVFSRSLGSGKSYEHSYAAGHYLIYIVVWIASKYLIETSVREHIFVW